VANLIGNAIKYGRPPYVLPAHEAREGLVVEVSDQGPGVSAEALPHLFDRFYKDDAARTRSDGSRLGLAIARANARLHAGDIEAASGATGGATFRLTLPRPEAARLE
jgi:two-component system sensor histidine kinase MtrB